MIRERRLLKIFLVFVISTTPLVGTIKAQGRKDTIQQKSEITISRSPAPLKSNGIRENILQKTQERLDMSINILNVVATLMGVLVALITIIVIIAIALGVFEYRRWKEIRQQAKKAANEAKKAADEVKKAAKEVKPIVDRLSKAKEDIENMRKSIGKISIPPEPALLPEELKKKLDEYGEKIKFLEAFGIPFEPEDYYNRGIDFYYKGQYELALKAFDKAIEMKPDFAEAWYNKGVTLAKLGRYDEALKAYDKAIEIKSDYAKAWYNKARMHSLKGNKENALKNLSRAIELDRKYKEDAKKDEDFKNLWDDEDFKRVTS